MYNIAEHKDFLESLDKYASAQRFWGDVIFNIGDAEFNPWVVNKYANGDEIMDGNPLFSTRFDNKAIRIIQLERNIRELLFVSWIDSRKYNDRDIQELVITLQPYQYVFEISHKVLVKFFKDELDIDYINELNDYFDRKWKRKQIEIVKEKLFETDLVRNLEVSINDLKNLDFDIRSFKRINEVSQHILFFEPKTFKNPELVKLFIDFSTTIDALNHVISINDNYHFTSLNKKVYLTCIDMYFKSVNIYQLGLFKNVNKLDAILHKIEKVKDKDIY